MHKLVLPIFTLFLFACSGEGDVPPPESAQTIRSSLNSTRASISSTPSSYNDLSNNVSSSANTISSLANSTTLVIQTSSVATESSAPSSKNNQQSLSSTTTISLSYSSTHHSTSSSAQIACSYTCSAHCLSISGTPQSGYCDDVTAQCCQMPAQETLASSSLMSSSSISSEPESNQGLTIYYIRHAETIANLNSDTQSTEGAEEFSDLGIRQVAELTDFLITENIHPNAIIVSPMWRAQKTIEPFLLETGLTAKIWPELNECCQGGPTGDDIPIQYDGYTFEIEISALNLEFRDSSADHFWYPITYEDGIYLVKQARDLLIQNFNQSGKTLVIVGHAGAGKTLIGMLLGYDMVTDIYERVYLFNTGVHRIQQSPTSGQFSLQEQNINNPEFR